MVFSAAVLPIKSIIFAGCKISVYEGRGNFSLKHLTLFSQLVLGLFSIYFITEERNSLTSATREIFDGFIVSIFWFGTGDGASE